MPKIKRREPPRHILVPDTNVLWYQDKDRVVSPDFDSFWHANGQKYAIELVLPAVVHGELLYQHTSSARLALERANNQFKNLSAIVARKYGHRVTEARVERDVRRKIDDWLATNGGRIEATPVGDIDWNRLIQDALWRRPPFLESKDNEKGFRDALILETVCAIAGGSPPMNIAFISADQLLVAAARQRISATCICYESLDEFSSYLNLLDERLTEEFVRAIQQRARLKFFAKNHDNCLFASAQIIRRIREQFGAELAPPKAPPRPAGLGIIAGQLRYRQAWEPITDESVWISPPKFVQLANEVDFDWSSEVSFVQLFRYSGPPVNAILLDSVQEGEERLRKLPFNVLWTARVSRDGRFRSMWVKEIRVGSITFSPPTNEDIERYGVRRQPPATGA